MRAEDQMADERADDGTSQPDERHHYDPGGGLARRHQLRQRPDDQPKKDLSREMKHPFPFSSFLRWRRAGDW